MLSCELGDRTSLPQVRLDQIPAHRHRRLLPTGCRLCLDTSLADVLVSDTITSTTTWKGLGEAILCVSGAGPTSSRRSALVSNRVRHRDGVRITQHRTYVTSSDA